jgi:hypothetical protein
LEKLFTKQKNNAGNEYITKEQFLEIANKYNIKDEDELLERLHDLGIALWYKDLQKYNTMILNPNWISDGIYTIINWGREAKKYAITLNDCTAIFKDEAKRFPEHKYEFFLDLMCQFELAYKSEKEFIIPILLPIDRPEKLPDFPDEGILIMQYKAEGPIPPDTISRFIVHHHTEIKNKESLWRFGVVLDGGNDTIALVREDDRSIVVSVKGSDKSNYISVLRKTLNEIFEGYKTQKPELNYLIIMPEGMNGEEWITERNLIGHIKKNRPYFWPEREEDIPLARTTEELAGIIEILQPYIESLITQINNQYNDLLKKGVPKETIDASIDALSAAIKAVKEGKNDKVIKLLKKVGINVGSMIKEITVGVLTNLASGKLGP